MTLVVVGSVGIDTVETPFGRVEDVVGGSAVYFSLAASLFTEVRVAANVGHDFPAHPWEALRARGADLSGLKVYPDQPTFRWTGRYQGDMGSAETLSTELNLLAVPPVVPADYRGAPFVFLANMGADVQIRMLDELDGATVFADTMNLWIRTQPEELREVLRRVDGLILNDGEARMLTGETNLIAAGSELLKMGPEIVVVKKGEHGAFLFAPEFHFALPAYPTTRVVDPTGAGDSFAGGFVGFLASAGEVDKHRLRQAMAYGTVAASLTVEKFSTQALEEASREDLDRRYAELREFVRLEQRERV
ncbi:MAG: sugar kinase [Planctomycetes bacterium]|nr:sugar kinase [Planctomycetota bacterium]MBL7007566.1 sugar kinase [Planctomycetota bacterium]